MTGNQTAKIVAMVLGIVCVYLVLGGLTALFFNWVIGLFVDWPVTWGNWAKTWLAVICFNLLFGVARRS